MVRRRRRRSGGDHEEHADERWLLTYADLITLLMALFMVLFSMSVVNKSKLESLKESLHNAFSPHVLPGGQSIKETGGDAQIPDVQPQVHTRPSPAGQTRVAASSPQAAAAAEQDDRQLRQLKAEVDKEAKQADVAGKVQTKITPRGLVIDILTDHLLFDSGQARIKPAGMSLLDRLAPLLQKQSSRAVEVEGHTDSQPIRGSVYPSNWELSTARASAVVRALISMNLSPNRLTATGRAYLDPSASNATEQGRAHNRRVEIVLPRRGA
jgi:chemotaxis protein MotB